MDLTLGEICRAAVDDPQVTSFALFLENIAGADDLREFAIAAAAHGKPVIAYKLGRSDAGAQLAVSHTGALAGDDAVADALLADLGIARVDTFEALLEGQDLARSVNRCGPQAARRCVVDDRRWRCDGGRLSRDARRAASRTIGADDLAACRYRRADRTRSPDRSDVGRHPL